MKRVHDFLQRSNHEAEVVRLQRKLEAREKESREEINSLEQKLKNSRQLLDREIKDKETLEDRLYESVSNTYYENKNYGIHISNA